MIKITPRRCSVADPLSRLGKPFGQTLPRGLKQPRRYDSIQCGTNFRIDMLSSHKLIRLLEKHLDDSRRLIGHRKSPEFAEVNGDPNLLAFCRWEQRVAG